MPPNPRKRGRKSVPLTSAVKQGRSHGFRGRRRRPKCKVGASKKGKGTKSFKRQCIAAGNSLDRELTAFGELTLSWGDVSLKDALRRPEAGKLSVHALAVFEFAARNNLCYLTSQVSVDVPPSVAARLPNRAKVQAASKVGAKTDMVFGRRGAKADCIVLAEIKRRHYSAARYQALTGKASLARTKFVEASWQAWACSAGYAHPRRNEMAKWRPGCAGPPPVCGVLLNVMDGGKVMAHASYPQRLGALGDIHLVACVCTADTGKNVRGLWSREWHAQTSVRDSAQQI